jgi:VCBS repeat-containing protein
MHRYQTKHKILSLRLVLSLLILTILLIFPSQVLADEQWDYPGGTIFLDSSAPLPPWEYTVSLAAVNKVILEVPKLMDMLVFVVNGLLVELEVEPFITYEDILLDYSVGFWQSVTHTINVIYGSESDIIEVPFASPLPQISTIRMAILFGSAPPGIIPITQLSLVYSLPNQAPVANDDAYSTDEDTTLNVAAPGVLGNDSDADGDPLTAVLDTGPGNGTLTLNADGSFTYTPDSDFNGIDSFIYYANDGSADSNTATVTITVDAVNDPPVATDDAYATDEDTTLNIAAPGMLGNDSDPDGDPLTVVVVTVPQHGSGSIGSDGSLNYRPDANFSGSDTFSYKASDGTAESNISTVTITVNPIDDPPVAVDDSATTNEDTTVTIPVLSNDSDIDGDALIVSGVTIPANGTVIDNGDGTVTYTPNANFNGTDSFSYKANDGIADSNTATVTITVNPVNDPPVADPNGPYSGTVGVPVTFYGSNSSDCDGTIVSYHWDFGDGAAGSEVSPAHTYSAAGIYTVTLTVNDNDGATHMATTSADIANIAPEEMIENLVDEIDVMELPEGIKNSLTASLDTAMKVLEDSNQKNDVAAINALEAFINEVEAQRDKKIPEEVADELIARAQDIIAVLSLGP